MQAQQTRCATRIGKSKYRHSGSPYATGVSSARHSKVTQAIPATRREREGKPAQWHRQGLCGVYSDDNSKLTQDQHVAGKVGTVTALGENEGNGRRKIGQPITRPRRATAAATEYICSPLMMLEPFG